MEEPQRPPAPYSLTDLDKLLHRPELLAPGIEIKPMGNGEYEFSMPGMAEPIRVTTNASYYEENPESTELWSPGSPLFPQDVGAASLEEVDAAKMKLADLLR